MHRTRKISNVCTLLVLSLLTACADEGDDTDQAPNPITAGDAAVQPPAPPPPQPNPDPAPYDDVVQLEVRNQTTRTIYQLYASPSASDRWGTNLLRGQLLAPGSYVVFESDYCDAYYDLKAVDGLGNTIALTTRIFFDCGRREIITLR